MPAIILGQRSNTCSIMIIRSIRHKKKQHQEFKKKTVDFCVETMVHKVTVPAEIFTYLKSWWTNHILKEDMKYKEFFNARGLR